LLLTVVSLFIVFYVEFNDLSSCVTFYLVYDIDASLTKYKLFVLLSFLSTDVLMLLEFADIIVLKLFYVMLFSCIYPAIKLFFLIIIGLLFPIYGTVSLFYTWLIDGFFNLNT
jgi:hypothetical protein